MTSTNTATLQLYKPTPGTNEPWDQTQWNSNMDKIDAALTGRASRFTTNTQSNTTSEVQQFGTLLAANQVQGAAHRMVAWGTYDNSAVATTITWRIKIGGVQITALVQNTPASLTTFVPWRIEFDLIVATTGGAGTWRGGMLHSVSPSSGAVNTFVAAGSATTRDTTTTNTMEITAQWAAAAAGNTIRCDAAYYHRVTNS
jgi:hypothetical protein